MGHLNIVLLLLQNGACPDATNIVSTAGRSLRVRGAVGEPDACAAGTADCREPVGREGLSPGGFPEAVDGAARVV